MGQEVRHEIRGFVRSWRGNTHPALRSGGRHRLGAGSQRGDQPHQVNIWALAVIYVYYPKSPRLISYPLFDKVWKVCKIKKGGR